MAKRLTPIQAIRRNCLECCGGDYREVEFCTSPQCSLYPYRLGHRPRATDYQYQDGDASIEAKDMVAIHKKRLAAKG